MTEQTYLCGCEYVIMRINVATMPVSNDMKNHNKAERPCICARAALIHAKPNQPIKYIMKKSSPLIIDRKIDYGLHFLNVF